MNNFNDPNTILKILYETFKVITQKYLYKNKNTGKDLDIDTLKKLYTGFYLGYPRIMENMQISDDIKKDLIAKKHILDGFFTKNIKNNNEKTKMLKIHRSVANRRNKISTSESSNNLNKIADNFSKVRLHPNHPNKPKKMNVSSTYSNL